MPAHDVVSRLLTCALIGAAMQWHTPAFAHNTAPAHAVTASRPARAVVLTSARALVGTPGRVHRIAGAVHWRADIVYELTGPVIVGDGGTLTIEAGARIEARPGAFLNISRDGRIIADGTLLQPIVLTCTSVPQYEGCWGGMTIQGFAPLNFGAATSPEARGTGAAGCPESGFSAEVQGNYGGCDPADSSGVVRYVRVEYASKGLRLLGVGSGTLVDFVQVNRSAADGVSVVGGNVDVRHLFLTANQGYGLSWRSGWRGRGQFITVQQDQRGSLGGLLGSNEGSTPTSFATEPRSAPTLLNVTIIAPPVVGVPVEDGPVALRLHRGTSGTLRNVLLHTIGIALDIDDSRTCVAGSSPLTITNAVIANSVQLGSADVDPLACEPYASPNVEAEWLGDPLNQVGVITDLAEANALIRLATNLIVPDLRPSSGGAAATNPAAVPPNDGFFDAQSTFIGAISISASGRNDIPWYSGWTVPAPIPPLGGGVVGTVSSPTLGLLSGIVIRAALGVETTSAPDGTYSLSLPAGEHQLIVSSVPIGCSAASPSVQVPSGGTVTVNVTVLCSTVASVSVGTFHACALSVVGSAQCWGNNEFGMLGDNSIVANSTPVLVAGSNVFNQGSVSSGYTHSCALRSAGAACWGLNFFGALGSGSAGFFAPAPATVGNGTTPSFVKLATGGYHACALTAAGAAWCWGWNQEGQAGAPPATSSVLLPAAAATGPLVFAQITAGESHTCALTAAGEAWCWGGNGRGELGTDPAVLGTASFTPVLVPGGHTFASIDGGLVHTCGVTTGGALYCWGSQESGQLGNGVVGGVTNGPVLVNAGTSYVQVSAGSSSTCAVTSTKSIQCWGAGISGVLGNATNAAVQSTPVDVSGGLEALGVVVNLSEPNGATACAVTQNGAAWCWGAGTAGQLGTGNLLSSNVPVQVRIRGPF